jgi:hypothetical protein
MFSGLTLEAWSQNLVRLHNRLREHTATVLDHRATRPGHRGRLPWGHFVVE